jgi:hypothetical protein
MGHPEEDGEPARWRSASFVSVSGLVDGGLADSTFHAVFKARTGQVMNGAYSNPVDGIYLRMGPAMSAAAAVVETGMDATLFDPEAVDPLTQEHLSVTEMGIERESFRGQWLAINVRMGAHEESGWAGIYLTAVPNGCTTATPGPTWVCVNVVCASAAGCRPIIRSPGAGSRDWPGTAFTSSGNPAAASDRRAAACTPNPAEAAPRRRPSPP